MLHNLMAKISNLKMKEMNKLHNLMAKISNLQMKEMNKLHNLMIKTIFSVKSDNNK
jgi:hypothetical protein